ncbi:MAG: hypothetical protein WB507_01775 [Solirubrobacterales bacterium]
MEEAWLRLESAVRAACKGSDEWPAGVAAGIYAALDLVVADPAAASRLLIERPQSRAEQRRRYTLGITRFAELLGERCPQEHPTSTHRAAIHSVAAMIADHVRSERQQGLAAIGPELVQLALLPYLSFAEAKGWAERTLRRDNLS